VYNVETGTIPPGTDALWELVDEQVIYINFCPFCGIKLPTTDEEIQKCLKK
jgi:hypothetical protein